MKINVNEIRDTNVRRRVEIALAAAARGDRYTESKRNGRVALDGKSKNKARMVNIPGSLHIRILRVHPEDQRMGYDDDNLSGGCKPLRDAIAAFLGRQGDSEKDGLSFSYSQEIGEPETVIEIYSTTGK